MGLTRFRWLLLVLLLPACASSGALDSRMGADQLFSYGMDRLRAEKWSDAIAAFERFTLNHAQDPRAAEARFRMAEAYFGRDEYVTSAMEFDRLANDYPAGPWADDARYMVCLSYDQLAPRPQLDQEYTRTAIDHCQSLISYYPESDFVPRARERIQTMTARLAEKEFNAGEYYFRRRAYDAANLYFQAVADNFPGTPWAPKALLRLYRSYERLDYKPEMLEVRERLLRDYPTSAEAQELNGAATPAQS